LLEGAALLLLMACAILFQRSATASWIELHASAMHYRVSPIGIAALPAGSSLPRSECRWWPRLGDAQLCSVNDTGGASQMTWIRRAYPLTVVAMWITVLALFLNALRIPRQAPAVGTVAAVIPSVLGIVALWSIWSGSARTFAVLEGLTPQPLSGGLTAIGAAIVSSTIAGLLLVLSKRR